ncbi:MAG TPA: hypothetical protein VK928_07080 [Longimicrobiales bacterium]|nr:hypothetical protein [Longimicrobiales bacterium]
MERRYFVALLAAAPVAATGGFLLRRAGQGETPAATLPGQDPQRALPAWFDDARVQGHTRLSLRWQRKSQFEHGASAAAALGATVLTRHVKTAGEPPWWASSVFPAGSEATAPGSVERMADEARANGVHLIAYYWHVSEHEYARTRPEWVCRDAAGEPASHNRGAYLDITGEYREVILARLLELAAMGVHGFYFDHTHVPVDGCRGTALEAQFTRETGRALKPKRDATDPDERAFHAFSATRVAATFRYWREEVTRRYPGVVFIVSTTYLPGLTSNRMSLDLTRVADSAKTEYFLSLMPARSERVFLGRNALRSPRPEHRMALGWTLLRDSAAGRPPHVWAPGFASPADARAFVGAVTAFGGIANIDIDEDVLVDDMPPAARGQRDTVVSAFELGRRISKVMGSTRPRPWAAVLISESARDARGGDYRRAWQEVLWPQTGAFGALLDTGVPVGTLDDAQLAAGATEGVGLIFVADAGSLDARQRSALDAFRGGGGKVIEQRAEWRWAEDGAGAALAFTRAVTPLLDGSPVRVRCGSGQSFGGAFWNADRSRLVVSVSNSFSWVRLIGVDGEREVADMARLPELAGLRASAPLQDVRVTVRGPRRPQRIVEAVSGTELTGQWGTDSVLVQLPLVEQVAFVALEY